MVDAEPPKNGKPPKQQPRSHWHKIWEQHMGPLVRFVEKMADGVCENHDPHHEAIKDLLRKATDEERAWMGIKE